MFLQELKLYVKNKFTILSFLLIIVMSIVFGILPIFEYSTVIYGNQTSKIYDGLEAYKLQNELEYKKDFNALDKELIDYIRLQLHMLNNTKDEEKKEIYYKNLSPYFQGQYLIEKVNADSRGKLEDKDMDLYVVREDEIKERLNLLDQNIIKTYESEHGDLKIPFSYYPMNGWSQMINNLAVLELLIFCILGLNTVRIFSSLKETGSYEIIKSCKNGKMRIVNYRILSRIFINLTFGILPIVIYLLIMFSYIAPSGGKSSIQMLGVYSPYNMNLNQALNIILIYYFLGIIYLTVFASFLSAISVDTVRASGLFIAFLLVYVIFSYYIKIPGNFIISVINNLLALFPFSSSDMAYDLFNFKAINLGIIAFPNYKVLFVLYIVISIILWGLCKWFYRKTFN